MFDSVIICNVFQVEYKFYLVSCPIMEVNKFAEVKDKVEEVFHFMGQNEITDVFPTIVFFVENTYSDLNTFSIFCHQYTNRTILQIILFE